MAEQPKYFDIEDTQTGKKYRIETDDPTATYDEAVEYFSTLPEQEWQAFEYKVPAAPATSAPPVAPRAGEAIVAPGATPRTSEEVLAGVAPKAEDYQPGMDNLFDFSPGERALTKPEEKALLEMANDPNIPVDQLQAFLRSRGFTAFDEGRIAEIEQVREGQKGFGTLEYESQIDGMIDKEAINEEYAAVNKDWFSQVGRSITEGWADPASLVNYLSRTGTDFFDLYEDELRSQFPDATPEQLDDLEQQYIAKMSKARAQAAQEGVSGDAFVPWLIGQFLALEPYDVLPFTRAASAGRPAVRALEKGIEGAVVATVGDLAGQALAMADGAQDKYDPLRTAGSAALSGVLGAGVQRIGDAVSDFRNRGTPRESSVAAITAPTADKRTKLYRTQLSDATNQIVGKVNELAEGWTNIPEVEVSTNFKGLKGIDDSAIGVYTTKTLEDGTTAPVIRINTEAVLARAKSRDVSPESVVEAVTFHESLGHHGLLSVFRDDLELFLDDIYVNGSEEFRSKVDDWLKKNPSAYSKLPKEQRRIFATEEVLADWSEGGPLPKTFIDNVLNLIKDFGRQMGATFNINKLKDIKYTSREVRAYLAVANDRTMRGTARTEGPDVDRNMDDPGYERTPDTTSAGFKRPKVDDRMRTEDRKLRQKNSYDPFAPPSRNPDGTPYTGPDPRETNKYSPPVKYMTGDGPIDPDQLSADDLIEARNALEVLSRVEYTPTVIPVEQLEAEIVGRGINPSDVTRLVGMQPGALVKRLFQYDLAASKIGERVATITMDIETNGLNDTNMANYVKATVAFNDILDKLFDLQGEFGRALAANRRVNYSRKRVSNLKDVLKEYDLESLADPETFMRYMAEMNGQMQAKRGKTTPTFGDNVISAVNIPRAIMSSADLSAPLRQGVVFVSYPEYWKSFAKMFTMITPSGERNYGFLMEKISRHPNYELMQKGRIAFSSLDGELSSREEDFQTEWARKLPVFGKIVKGSEQAYAGFLNKLRADMFNRFVADYRKTGIFDGTQKDADGNLVVTPEEQELLTGLGQFINAGTGRAELPQFLRPSSTIINATFFSGRLMYSRAQMLNPQFYAQLPPPVRKEALRSMIAFGGIAGLVGGAVNALWPDYVEVELDPRSSDFMKIKVGDTRFDIGGGFNQYLILGARTGTWLYNNTLMFGDRQAENLGFETSFQDAKVANKKTAAGNYREYGNDTSGQETYAGAIGQFFRSKLSPQASYVVDGMVGADYVGQEFTLEGSLASRLVPMTASSLYEAYEQDSPVPLAFVGAASLFGTGVSTYKNTNEDPDQELKAPASFKMADLEDGENEDIRAEDGEVTLKKAARDRWTATINNYYPVFLEQFTIESGYKTFDEAPSEVKEEIISDAKNAARNEAKKDMMYELGLED